MPRKRGTRGNIRKYRGYTLHSDLELTTIKQLYSDRRKLKRTFDFKYEPELLPYTIRGEYKPDFIIEIPETQQKIYVECKGYLDENSRRKMIAVREEYPDLDIRILFSKNNKLRKNSKMRYFEWALRNGFNDVHIGECIPVEWLLGKTINKDKNNND